MVCEDKVGSLKQDQIEIESQKGLVIEIARFENRSKSRCDRSLLAPSFSKSKLHLFIATSPSFLKPMRASEEIETRSQGTWARASRTEKVLYHREAAPKTSENGVGLRPI